MMVLRQIRLFIFIFKIIKKKYNIKFISIKIIILIRFKYIT